MKTLHLKTSIDRSPLRLGFLVIPLMLACFALAPAARADAEGAVCRDGCTLNAGNTFQGENALNSATGFENTAFGSLALFANTTGGTNTGIGAQALFSNTTAEDNTGIGAGALLDNTTGELNTAVGVVALGQNTAGSLNTAVGVDALRLNQGDNNTALGAEAGVGITSGSNNIDIGAEGKASDSGVIRIGTVGTQTLAFIAGIFGTGVSGVPVMINSNGRLGTLPSSARFKEEIKPIDKASEAILALKPVSFRYKKEIDAKGIPQFGLVAEQVEKVNPDLVARDEQGKPYTVRYEAVNAMLLNEFLKEHRTVQELKKDVAALTATVKEQASQIQKVSAQLEVSKPAPQVVNNP